MNKLKKALYRYDFARKLSKKYFLKLYKYKKHSFEDYIVDYFDERIQSFIVGEYSEGSISSPFSCSVFWINSDNVNAHVYHSKYANTYYIGINKGLLTELSRNVIETQKNFPT